MAFAEDMGAFFSVGDFAVAATFTPTDGGPTVSASVILDAPTEDVLGGDALSDEYAITYPATELAGIRAGASGVIAGVSYKVRDVRLLDDGKLKRAKLSKV